MDIRLDEGFLFGMGVFETVAVEQGRPLLLEQHLNRMQGSADFLKLGSCAERGLTKEKIAEYLSTQEMSVKMHGALKIVMSAENTFFQMRENPYMDEIYSRGFMTDLSKVRLLHWFIIRHLIMVTVFWKKEQPQQPVSMKRYLSTPKDRSVKELSAMSFLYVKI